eukprot:3726581-Rhodomonas_salina.5
MTILLNLQAATKTRTAVCQHRTLQHNHPRGLCTAPPTTADHDSAARTRGRVPARWRHDRSRTDGSRYHTAGAPGTPGTDQERWGGCSCTCKASGPVGTAVTPRPTGTVLTPETAASAAQEATVVSAGLAAGVTLVAAACAGKIEAAAAAVVMASQRRLRCRCSAACPVTMLLLLLPPWLLLPWLLLLRLHRRPRSRRTVWNLIGPAGKHFVPPVEARPAPARVVKDRAAPPHARLFQESSVPTRVNSGVEVADEDTGLDGARGVVADLKPTDRACARDGNVAAAVRERPLQVCAHVVQARALAFVNRQRPRERQRDLRARERALEVDGLVERLRPHELHAPWLPMAPDKTHHRVQLRCGARARLFSCHPVVPCPASLLPLRRGQCRRGRRVSWHRWGVAHIVVSRTWVCLPSHLLSPLPAPAAAAAASCSSAVARAARSGTAHSTAPPNARPRRWVPAPARGLDSVLGALWEGAEAWEGGGRGGGRGPAPVVEAHATASLVVEARDRLVVGAERASVVERNDNAARAVDEA